jgi:hypothetical protein
VTASAWDNAAKDLYAKFQAGAILPADMVVELPQIWRFRSDEDPLNSADAWRAMVKYASYFEWKSGRLHGRRTRRPLRSKRLFRGATLSRRFGMSWTKNPDIAEHFARVRQPHDELGQVWVATFRPSRLLGYLADEKEYLVDAAGADVQLWRPRGLTASDT